MGKGYIRITNKLIQDALRFPNDWEIEEITPSFNRAGLPVDGESIMLISGSDFPKTNNRGQAEDVTLTFHKEATRIEVERIDNDK